MQKIKNASLLLVIATLFMSAKSTHETQITIISPKTDVSYKKGQSVDIHFKVRCGEHLKSLSYQITDPDNKVLFSKQPNVTDKNTHEEKDTWTATQVDPSVLTLSIDSKDIDGHSANKIIQFNINF